MAALRFLSMLLLVVAALLLATDATRAIGGQASLFTPLAKHWSDVAPASFAAARRSTQAGHPAAWDYVVAPVLRLPGWMSFGTLGLIAGYAGRHRRRINIFTN